MFGIPPIPTVICKGLTGPTRSSFDWNTTQAPAANASRWARRSSAAFSATILGQIIVGTTTTLTSLVATVYGTPLVTDSITFTLQKGGVDTALTVTLAAGAATATGTGSVAVVPGDYLTVKALQSGTEAQGSFILNLLAAD